jgi:hypothetical protein
VICYDRRELLLLGVILLLATALRVGKPTLAEFKYDEARVGALALELTREGHLPLVGVPSSAGFNHSPISVYLYVPAFLFTTSPLPATIYSGLVGVAAVALCWWLARRWAGGGQWGALVASLLFAVSPWLVAFNRKVWQIAFVPLLTLAFVGLAISALIAGRRWHLCWTLVVYAILVQVHPSAVALAPALLLWLILFRHVVRLSPLAVGGALGLLTALPFLLFQARNDWTVLAALRALPEATWDLSAIHLAWEATTGRGIAALAGSAYPFLKIVPQLGWVFNLVGWLTLASCLVLVWRVVVGWRAREIERQQAARVDLIVLSWLVIPIVFNLRHSLELHLHSFALLAPAAYLIIGRATDTLLGSVRLAASGRALPGAAVRSLRIAYLAAVGFLVSAQIVALVLMARFVATHETPGGFGKPLGHYLDIADALVDMAEETHAAEVLIVGQGDSPEVDESPALFDILLRDRIPYRFVDGTSAALFPPHRSLALVAPGAGEAADWYDHWPAEGLPGDYRIVALDGSWPQDGLEPVAGPRVFENGVEVQSRAWAGGAKPGVDGDMWLLWQVLWLSPDDTHFFVHAVDKEGQIWGQQDAVGYPTAYRRKGDRVVNRFHITISADAPPGPYGAEVGLYLFPEVINVPVIDEAGHPVADAVVLGPVIRTP